MIRAKIYQPRVPVIEALQWMGDVVDVVGAATFSGLEPLNTSYNEVNRSVEVVSPNGILVCMPGDYLVRINCGLIHVVPKRDFEELYELCYEGQPSR